MIRRPGWFAAHTLAQAFFLYMFFSAGRIERLVDEGRVVHVTGGDAAAYRYAARWRHGMTEGWLLYMPGFFLTAATAWFWSQTLPPASLARQGATTLAAGSLAALAASMPGGAAAISDFVRDTGARVTSPSAGISMRAVAQGVYTLVAWTAFATCGRKCIERRSFNLLWIPALLGVLLLMVRPFTLDDAGDVWAQRAVQGDPVAIVSALLVPATGWFLVHAELARLKWRKSNDVDAARVAPRA